MTSPHSRTPLIDMIKGVACATIVWHHLAFYGPMSDIAQPLAPDLMAWLYDYGRMAVQVFLVLGGYLAAASLAPQGLARFDSARQQITRRFVRLVVPYSVALLLAVLVAALVGSWMDHPSVPGAPDLGQLVANALLLQDIVGEEALSAGVWYVAIDFQLFAGSVLLLALVRALCGDGGARHAGWLGRALVVVGTAMSLLVFNREPQLDMWALYFFGAYGLGMMACWAVQAPRAGGWMAAITLLGIAALVLDFRARIAVALVTALALAWALRSPRWRQWQGFAPWCGSVRCRIRFFWCIFRCACWSMRWSAMSGRKRPNGMRWACWPRLPCRCWQGSSCTRVWNATYRPGPRRCAGRPGWWAPACWWP